MHKGDRIERIQNFVEIKGHPNLIVIDPDNKIRWKDCFNHLPILSVDLSRLNNITLEEFVLNLLSNLSQILLIKNIDNIHQTKEKKYWESIITIGLKGEECPITLETKEGYYKTFNLPLDKVKIITICSQYPDFLKDKGILGYIVDLS